MNAITRHRSQPLAAAIDAGLPRTAGRLCTGSLAALTLMMALGCATSAAAANTFYVTTSGDPGPAGTQSLRQAVAQANASAGNAVQFDASLVGSTITLASGEIAINQSMKITGPGANQLTVSGNNASRIFYILGSLTSNARVTIAGLTLTRGQAPEGGAVNGRFTDLILRDSVISASTASYGGGIHVVTGSVYARGVRIVDNYATRSGGGINVLGANLSVTDSTISGNAAGEHGGGIFVSNTSSLDMDYSQISGNTVPTFTGPHMQGGGGITLENVGSANVLNSTISGNYAYSGGGGIQIMDAATGNGTRITFSTIAGNFSYADSGNGVYAPAGTPRLDNSIVANNGSRANSDDLLGNFTSNYSLIRNLGSAVVTSVGSVIGLDPQLGPLGDNGGATLTMLPAAVSPVIHAAQLLSPIGEDQRRLPRPPSARGDIGAVERQYPEDIIFRNGFDSS